MRTITGKVISNKMNGVVTVLVERRLRHPLYGKIIRKSSKIHAQNTVGAQIGQLVAMEESRPLAKTVSFKVIKIVGHLSDGVLAVAGPKRRVKAISTTIKPKTIKAKKKIVESKTK